MKHQIITTQTELEQLCTDLAGAESIAFDTEFVSEHTYRPTLCLVQVAAARRLAVIDPLDLQDLAPFWKLLAQPGHETIVHAGREELIFCYEAVSGPPANLFDVQRAAGLVGFEYPAGYATLLTRLSTIATFAAEQLTKGVPLETLMGSPIDAAKLVSSMTLFSEIAARLPEADRDQRINALSSAAAAILEAAEEQGYPRCAHTLAVLRG